jgi:hypothetical protein
LVHPPRKVPAAIKDRLKKEIDRLVDLNILTPVTEPTPWVVVDRPGKLRICLDPKDLNKALKRSHYPLPTIEDILPRQKWILARRARRRELLPHNVQHTIW